MYKSVTIKYPVPYAITDNPEKNHDELAKPMEQPCWNLEMVPFKSYDYILWVDRELVEKAYIEEDDFSDDDITLPIWSIDFAEDGTTEIVYLLADAYGDANLTETDLAFQRFLGRVQRLGFVDVTVNQDLIDPM